MTHQSGLYDLKQIQGTISRKEGNLARITVIKTGLEGAMLCKDRKGRGLTGGAILMLAAGQILREGGISLAKGTAIGSKTRRRGL